MEIGEKIKIARESAGMTQEELGAACGTTKQTVFKYETGIITNIPLDKLEKIANVLCVDPAYLLGWQNTTTAPTVRVSPERQELLDMVDSLTDEEVTRLLQIARLVTGG